MTFRSSQDSRRTRNGLNRVRVHDLAVESRGHRKGQVALADAGRAQNRQAFRGLLCSHVPSVAQAFFTCQQWRHRLLEKRPTSVSAKRPDGSRPPPRDPTLGSLPAIGRHGGRPLLPALEVCPWPLIRDPARRPAQRHHQSGYRGPDRRPERLLRAHRIAT